MELHYLILAHKNPEQVKRLISRLSAANTSFYLHVDWQSNLTHFRSELKDFNVTYVIPRFKGTWGDVGIVKATIEGMKIINNTSKDGYVILLSGQDYPLRSNHYIYNYLREKFPTEFITIYPMPHGGWKNGGMDRLEKYKINKSEQRKHFLQLASIFDKEFYNHESLGKLNFLRKTKRYKEIGLILKKRKFPDYIKAYGGSQWWALTMSTVKLILDFIQQNPDYLKFHNYTLLPDEIFFQSILKKIEDQQIDDLVIERSFTYVNWERPRTPLPVTFSKNDFTELKEASKDMLFARKFDFDIDQEILDTIDLNLLTEKKHGNI